jgi:hypothetical protein
MYSEGEGERAASRGSLRFPDGYCVVQGKGEASWLVASRAFAGLWLCALSWPNNRVQATAYSLVSLRGDAGESPSPVVTRT